jgi:hypothetical protein
MSNTAEVEHKVRIWDFENWLASSGESPAQKALKSDLLVLIEGAVEERSECRS